MSALNEQARESRPGARIEDSQGVQEAEFDSVNDWLKR